MKPILCLLLTCLLHAELYAQHSDWTEKYPRSYNAFKFGTGETLFINPMLQFAFEKRWNTVGTQISVGFSVPQPYELDSSDHMSGKTYGYTIRGEGRWYFFSHKPISLYSGLEVYYKAYSTERMDEFGGQAGALSDYEDTYLIDKSAYAAAGKVGFAPRFGRHFLIDISIGLGVKVTTITSKGRQNPKDRRALKSESWLFPTINEDIDPGTSIDGAMPFNFSVGYYFR